MKNGELKEKPIELRIATALLWSAFVVSLLLGNYGSIINVIFNDSSLEPSILISFIIGIILGLSFLIFEAFAIYSFSLMRNWARIAILVLFLMGASGSLWLLPMEYANSTLKKMF